ncbi:unnamed protein product, partial [Protopolystoma xenopodis]
TVGAEDEKKKVIDEISTSLIPPSSPPCSLAISSPSEAEVLPCDILRNIEETVPDVSSDLELKVFEDREKRKEEKVKGGYEDTSSGDTKSKSDTLSTAEIPATSVETPMPEEAFECEAKGGGGDQGGGEEEEEEEERADEYDDESIILELRAIQNEKKKRQSDVWKFESAEPIHSPISSFKLENDETLNEASELMDKKNRRLQMEVIRMQELLSQETRSRLDSICLSTPYVLASGVGGKLISVT